jgi:hypothetical protein
MPLINFKERFVPLIESGKKRQTIRIKRKNPIKAGDTLHLYTGLRTKKCRLIKKVVCKSVHTISIGNRNLTIHNNFGDIICSPNIISMLGFAKADGFNSEDEFFEFFSQPMYKNKQLQLIKW